MAVQQVQPEASNAQSPPGKRGCFLLPEALSVRMRAGALYCTSDSSGSTSENTCTGQRAASLDNTSDRVLQTQHSPCWSGFSSHVQPKLCPRQVAEGAAAFHDHYKVAVAWLQDGVLLRHVVLFKDLSLCANGSMKLATACACFVSSQAEGFCPGSEA